MKRLKLFTLILIFAVLFGGCSGKNTSETSENTSETTTEASESSSEPVTDVTKTTVTETTETEPEDDEEQVTDFDDLKINDYISISARESSYIPHFLLEGDDFDKANKEIDEWSEKYISGGAVRYAFIKADSRRYSLVVYSEIYSYAEWRDFLCFTFDVETNEILDNETILALAQEPLSEFYDDARCSMVGILDECGDEGLPEDEYELTISSERINKDMIMFLGNNDRLILCSAVVSSGGASSYNELWDLYGICYSLNGSVDSICFADDFFASFDLEEKWGYCASLFAHRNEAENKIEFYEYVDGELVFFDSIPLDGTVYRTSGDSIYFKGNGGSLNKLIIDAEGKIKAKEL